MADLFLTLAQLTKRHGSDAAVGLVEEVRTFAPELNVVSGRPISGTSYKVTRRKLLPTTPAFRAPNSGQNIVSSVYEQIIGETFFLDCQMQIDEAIVQGDDRSIGDLLTDESIGALKQKLIAVGSQFYYGTSADANGFIGLQSQVASSQVVSAGGSTSTSSAYLIVNGIQEVGFVFGKMQGLQMNAWNRQQVKDSSSKSFMAWVNNLSGWIGLAFNYTNGAARIKLLDQTEGSSGHGLTDKLVAQALKTFPVGVVPTHLFCSRAQRYMLQQSRTPTYSGSTNAITSNMPLQFAPTPTESNGIPLYVTDSISDSET